MNDDIFAVALTRCFFCNESDKLLMNTRLTPRDASRVKEAHQKVIDMDPCNTCKDLMKKGVILITVDENKSVLGWNTPPADPDDRKNWMPNPYRTGGWFVITDEAVRRIIHPEEMANWAIKHRWMFIAHEAATMMGLFEVTPLETRKARP